MTAGELMESRLGQAVVAGVFVALGWLVNGWSNRREAARRRAERLRDYHRAVFAEIASYLDNLGSVEALAAYRDEVVAAMERDPDHVPLIPRERNDTVFRALVEEISILPRVTIDPIVVYYNQLFAIEALIEDMRGERFRVLAQGRRIVMYRDYMALKVQAFHDGHYALRMIAAFSEGGREAAQREEAQIARELAGGGLNSPAAVRSGRSRE